MGLPLAKSYPSKSASKTGTVRMCCAIMSIAASSVTDSFIEPRSSSWKPSNHSSSAALARIVEQSADPLDQPSEDVGNVLGPGLPVLSVSAPFDDPGVDGVGREVEGRKVEGQLVVPTGVDVAVNDDPVRLPLVQVDAVDLGVEAVVVGPERAENPPHGAEALVVVQRLFGGHPRRNRNRQHNVAVFLALRLPHDAPDRLHDFDPGTCAPP